MLYETIYTFPSYKFYYLATKQVYEGKSLIEKSWQLQCHSHTLVPGVCNLSLFITIVIKIYVADKS